MPTCFQHAPLNWNPICGNLLVTCFRHKLDKLSIIITYTATDVAEDHTKDEFYSKLKFILNSLRPHYLSLVLIDKNVTVSSSACDPNTVPHVTGTVFVDMVTNDNGECLPILFCCAGYCLADPYFPCMCVHQWVYYSPDDCAK